MAKSGKPNILFIMADDIGWFNLSCYNHGLMGYRTPNMDRIAREGAMFTDFYGQQSCTAGRAAFLTGQQPIRTGLTKVGMPGATLGIKAEDVTLAQVLKSLGYATGQFGKNHLGDRNEHLPTVHGFDEFFGNLYHLNAEEEPEYVDYPKDPQFKAKFGPRGVLKCKATDKDDATVDPVFGKVGRQTIENTGPLTKKRMETVDEEFLASALDFMERKTKENVPWLCYFNPTRMHVFTHLKPSSVGKTGHGLYPDGMVELDGYVGDLLKKVDDLGAADNTIVVFTTDNGAEECIWPDGGATPFRGEKDTNWEGGWRVPCVMRWPGVIKPGEVINEMGSLTDFLPTFAAAAGDPDIVAKLKKGHDIGGTTFKVHIDGHNLMPFLSGKGPCPRDRLHLLERRWRPDGVAGAAVQDRVRRAARDGTQRLARAAEADAHPQDVRSAIGSVRGGRGQHQIQRLVRRARPVPVRRAGGRAPVARELQRVPTATKGGELHGRSDRRETDAEIVGPRDEVPMLRWPRFSS